MALTKKIDFGKVSKELTDSRVKKIRLLGNDIVADMHSRTLKGEDVTLGTFKEYSDSYKKQRSKKGRKTKPNLTYTGNMLGGMMSKKIPNGLKFTFTSSSELKKAEWNQKTRKFFGIDKNQKASIKKTLSKL